MYDFIVVGGGAAGMMAAGIAARTGKKVLLLERHNKLGIKLSISGKGRCNITNSGDISDFMNHYGANGRFLYNAFHQFFNEDLINFFKEIGVNTKVERGGRVFPLSDDADMVVDALKRFLLHNKVEILFHKRVKQILLEKTGVRGVRTFDLETFYGDSVLVATGGLSYPHTGSTGDGYELLKAVGHRILKLLPSLVGLETNESYVKDLQGLSLKNINASLLVNGKRIKSLFGEMVFTHFGLSGPVILSLSRDAAGHLADTQSDVEVSLHLKPALDVGTLNNRLLREINGSGSRHYGNLLRELLPKKLIPIFIMLSKIAPDKKSNQITQTERKRIIALLEDLRFTIKKTRPIEEAIVTQGGADVSQVNPKTMESKLVRSLYIAGEVLDIDGLTGGYNLQAAFSTGYAAGISAGA
ncbi:MAG: NAD(P)/FAD-dependent oxidoreductase [Candidatus Omnitrophota bacterium]